MLKPGLRGSGTRLAPRLLRVGCFPPVGDGSSYSPGDMWGRGMILRIDEGELAVIGDATEPSGEPLVLERPRRWDRSRAPSPGEMGALHLSLLSVVGDIPGTLREAAGTWGQVAPGVAPWGPVVAELWKAGVGLAGLCGLSVDRLI